MSNPLGWDYPAGAEHDPSAPYNQIDPDPCEECDGEGTVTDRDGSQVRCSICDGEGHVIEEPRHREYERDDE